MTFQHKSAVAFGLLAAALLSVGGVLAQDTRPAPPAANTTSANTGTQVRSATSGVMQDRSSKSKAEALYVEKCGMCHRQMGMGTVILARRMDPAVAMLEARRELPPEFFIQAARAGIGNMPRISRGEVSDAQLEQIARYLARSEK